MFIVENGVYRVCLGGFDDRQCGSITSTAILLDMMVIASTGVDGVGVGNVVLKLIFPMFLEGRIEILLLVCTGGSRLVNILGERD